MSNGADWWPTSLSTRGRWAARSLTTAASWRELSTATALASPGETCPATRSVPGRQYGNATESGRLTAPGTRCSHISPHKPTRSTRLIGRFQWTRPSTVLTSTLRTQHVLLQRIGPSPVGLRATQTCLLLNLRDTASAVLAAD